MVVTKLANRRWDTLDRDSIELTELARHFELYNRTDGKSPTNLTNNPAEDSLPAWSPDGRKIAFISDRDGNEEIYVMDAIGSNQTNHLDACMSTG